MFPSSCPFCIKKTYLSFFTDSPDIYDLPVFSKFLILYHVPIVIECSENGNIKDYAALNFKNINSSKEEFSTCVKAC